MSVSKMYIALLAELIMTSDTFLLDSVQMYGFGKYVFDVACELHGKYVPDNKEDVGEEAIQMIDIEQEADLVVATEVGQAAEGQPPLLEREGEILEEPLLKMPPSPPPIGVELLFVT